MSARFVEHFKTKISKKEETRRIKKESTPAALRSAADCIAEQVQGERPISAPVLCGVVHYETNKALSERKCKMQSLRAKLSNSESKSKKKTNLKKSTPAKIMPSKYFQQRSGKVTRKGSANKAHGPPKQGNATTATKKNSAKQNSAGKSDVLKKNTNPGPSRLILLWWVPQFLLPLAFLCGTPTLERVWQGVNGPS